MRISLFLLALLCFSGTVVQAQTTHQNSGWLFLLNNTKINDKWGAYIDVQLRSADELDHLKNMMFRPGITYYINDKSEATLGYLFNQTQLKPAVGGKDHLVEHRIWQQYVLKQKISTISVSHRFRLEQRFIGQANDQEIFAQRMRYFVRFILPLGKGKQQFNEGAFVALQNELFFNVQNNRKINGSLFDQNRAYAAGGYRFNKKFDLEAGYLNQAVKGLHNNSINHVVQVALYTKF